MRIEDERRSDSVSFRDIECGDVFECDRQYFLKIHETEMGYNAADLSNGHGRYFQPSSTVIYLPDAVLRIK